ncbi:lactocepin [Arcanobacterium wilhelmae]|uniref:Lactocepin n=1 Tax=Arcanobacterium wilhelmae TaxID=1803177 RepID=A0ABT9NC53_9ACTO|nr:S8 family serine peptidase [Arcanobacterium wilhelmae]MDP9801294.1 lactocepin [Arcanobacterium wilhelmae]
MKRFRRSFAVAAALATSLGMTPTAMAAPSTPPSDGDAQASNLSLNDMKSLLDAAGEQASGTKDVLIMLDRQPKHPSKAGEKANLGSQNELIATLGKKYGLKVKRQLGFLVNGFSATVRADKIAALAQEPGVKSVKEEQTYQRLEHNARKMEGVPTAYERHGLDGTGTVVAVIDSGIDVAHRDLRLDDGVCEKSKLKPDTAHGFTYKVPAGYNFANENYEVKDAQESQHGQHVSGIVGANGSGRDGNNDPSVVTDNSFDGVAPNAQILGMKVFSNVPGEKGATDSDIIAAIEQSVKLKADVINMSLGSPNGNRNASDGAYRAIQAARDAGVMVVVAAGNEGLNFDQAGELGDSRGQLDDGTLGSPASSTAAFSVASIDNSVHVVPVANWKSGENGEEQHIKYSLATGKPDDQYHRIFSAGLGTQEEFDKVAADIKGNFVLVARGKETFANMFKRASQAQASGILVYNKDGLEEFIGMAGTDGYTFFGASTYNSIGKAIRASIDAGTETYVKFTNERKLEDFGAPFGMRPSAFTSWGATPNLDFSPQIAGIGGEVYSTMNDNKYASESGTSMASPNVAGLSALLIQHYKTVFPDLSGPQLVERVRTAFMNTAQIPLDEKGTPHAPRQIGAGLARIDLAAENRVFATVNGEPSVALREVNGPRTFTVDLHNLGEKDVTYRLPKQTVVNESNEKGKNITTSVSSETLTSDVATVTVPKGATAKVNFTLAPNTDTPHFIEGWARLEGTAGTPNLSIPYLGFVGDWNKEQIVEKPGVPWGDPVEYDTSTGLMTLRQDTSVFLDTLDKTKDDPKTGRDLTLWISPNGDKMQDVVFPSLLLRRNASDVEYRVYNADKSVDMVLGKEQDVRRPHTNVNFKEDATPMSMMHSASSYAFDGTQYDPKDPNFKPVPDGKYTFEVKARLSDQFGWQTTAMNFGIDTVKPVLHIGDLKDGYVYFTAADSGSGVQVNPVVNTDKESNLVAERVGEADSEFRVKVADGTQYVEVTAGDMASNIATAHKILDPANLLAVAFKDAINDEPVGPVKPYFVADNGPQLDVSGYTDPSAAKVLVNGKEADLDKDGYFSGVADLKPGANEVTVVALDADGKELAKVVLHPYYDAKPPVVTLNPEAAKLSDDGKSVTVSGTITDEHQGAPLTVKVAGKDAVVGLDGRFTATVDVEPDALAVPVVGSDGANLVTVAAPIEGRAPAGPPLPPPPPPAPPLPPSLPGSDALPTIINAQCLPGLIACGVSGETTDYDAAAKLFTVRGMLDPDVIAKVRFVPAAVASNGAVNEPAPIDAVINAKEGTFEAPLAVVSGENHYRMEVYVKGENGKDVLTKAIPFKLYFDVELPHIVFDQPHVVAGSIFTNTDGVDFTGKISDDAWGYTFSINGSVVEQRSNNSGLGPKSNERTFKYHLDAMDGDKALITVEDLNGNKLIGLYPIVVDKDDPVLGFLKGGGPFLDGSTIRDGEPVVATAKDPHLGSLAVKVTGPDGYTWDASAKSDVDTTPLPLEELLVDVATIAPHDGEAPAEPEPTPSAEPSAEPSTEPSADPSASASGAIAIESAKDTTVAAGNEAKVTDTELLIPFATKDLKAGMYTMVSTSTDLAGNSVTKAVTFYVDRMPVIAGPQRVELTLTPQELANRADVIAKVLANYSVTDDGSADYAGDGSQAGDPKLAINPTTFFTNGENLVAVRAVQPNGVESRMLVNVVITVKEPAAAEVPAEPEKPGEPQAPNSSPLVPIGPSLNITDGVSADDVFAGIDQMIENSGKLDLGELFGHKPSAGDKPAPGVGDKPNAGDKPAPGADKKPNVGDKPNAGDKPAPAPKVSHVTPKSNLAFTGASTLGLAAAALAMVAAGALIARKRES